MCRFKSTTDHHTEGMKAAQLKWNKRDNGMNSGDEKTTFLSIVTTFEETSCCFKEATTRTVQIGNLFNMPTLLRESERESRGRTHVF